jgi:hypothetical protein
VLELLEIFSASHTNLKQAWGEMSLKWASQCPSRHIVCRSLQIFRVLEPGYSQRMLACLLHCLLMVVSDENPDFQGVAIELLDTFVCMVNVLDYSQIDTFPQIFWGAVAVLTSGNMWEFERGLEVLSIFVSKMVDHDHENALLINLPTKWKHEPLGVIFLLLRGLNLPKTEKQALAVMSAISRFEGSVFLGEAHILFVACANMPRLLQGFETNLAVDGGSEVGLTIDWCLQAAQFLADLTDRIPDLSRLYTSYYHKRFRSKTDFLRQFIQIIQTSFFPAMESQVIQLYLNMLNNKIFFYQRQSLEILAAFLHERQSNQPIIIENREFVDVIVNLIETDMTEAATSVLDTLIGCGGIEISNRS